VVQEVYLASDLTFWVQTLSLDSDDIRLIATRRFEDAVMQMLSLNTVASTEFITATFIVAHSIRTTGQIVAFAQSFCQQAMRRSSRPHLFIALHVLDDREYETCRSQHIVVPSGVLTSGVTVQSSSISVRLPSWLKRFASRDKLHTMRNHVH
jgi:hypothetical protein